MKTLAAILVENKRPLELALVEIPLLRFGQVLVELQTSRICGSQLGEIDGVKGDDCWLPHLLGHEGSGIVREIGPEVTHVKQGDHVVLHWRPGKGIEARSPQYLWNGKPVNAGFVTTFNHFAVVSENRLTPVPETLDKEVAALMADTITTGFGIINGDAGVRIGESVVLFGCGGIGLGVTLGASLAGAYPIVAVDLYDHKLAKAKAFGATHTFNASTAGLEAFIRDLVGMDGADVVIDGTGNPEMIAQAYQMTAKQGRTVLFGVMPDREKLSINTLPLHFGKILTGSEGGGSYPDKEIPRYVRMIEAGLFDVKEMVSHRGKLDEVNDLIAKMRNGEVIHAIMQYGQK